MKANRALEGTPCVRCSEALAFGEDVVVCNACEVPYHADCWDLAGGCSEEGCENEPLKQLETQAQVGAPEKEELQPGMMYCPHCGNVIPRNSRTCSYCRKIPAVSLHRLSKKNAPGAVASLVYGIIGLFTCWLGVLFGIIAIVHSNQARKKIARNPRFTGEGLAIAGLILGIISLVWGGLLVLITIVNIPGH